MNNIIQIFYFKQTEKLSDKNYDLFLMQMPSFFQEEIKKYKFRQSAEASLIGKVLLQYGFQQLNLQYNLQDIKISSKERPFINSEIDFNISHSGKYIVCAIAKQVKVGIDIEMHRELKSDIANRYFNSEECAEIKKSDNASKTFFDLWSLKESAIKCDGRGVEVLSKTQKLYNSNEQNQVICDDVLMNCFPVQIEDGYSCHVCSNVPFETVIKQLELPDLLKGV